MADTKLADLTSGAPAAATDIIYAVKDPGGTPVDAKLTLGEVKTLVNTPGGSDTQVQFNDGGAFGGDSGLTFNKTSKSFSLGGATVTASAPVLDATQTWNASGVTFTGLKFNATDTASAAASLLMDLQVGGSSQFRVVKDGTVRSVGPIYVSSTLASGIHQNGGRLTLLSNGAASMHFPTDTEARLGSTSQLCWSSSTSSTGGTTDLFLSRRGTANLRLGAADAAAPVAQTLSVQSVVAGTTNTAGADLTITGSQGTGTGAGGSIIFQVAPAGSSGTAQNSLVTFLEATSARAFNLYNTADVTTNFERGRIAWESNNLRIGTQAGGTGSLRPIEFQQGGTTRLSINAGGSVIAHAAFYGASGSTYIGWVNNALMTSPSNGVIRLTNWAETDFNRLQFGGTTSSFPAIKRSSAALQVRLADDSANAALESASLKTDAPTGGTSGTWKLGARVAATTTLDTTQYIELDVGGTLYKLAVVTS